MLSQHPNHKSLHIIRYLLPTPGNVIFTLLVVSSLLWVQSAGAFPKTRTPATIDSSLNTIPYQGFLTDINKQPLDGTFTMTFRLYNVAEGGTPLWEEFRTGSNSVQVREGLFDVMLGESNPIPIAVVGNNSSLWLGTTVNTDEELLPRVQVGSVPFAVQALTVPDASITSEKMRPTIEFATIPRHQLSVGSCPSDGAAENFPLIAEIPIETRFNATYMIWTSITTRMDVASGTVEAQLWLNEEGLPGWIKTHHHSGGVATETGATVSSVDVSPGSYVIRLTGCSYPSGADIRTATLAVMAVAR
ncbi:MAG: hypothetical protein AAF702_22450 [Chloroflexota bacterium]